MLISNYNLASIIVFSQVDLSNYKCSTIIALLFRYLFRKFERKLG